MGNQKRKKNRTPLQHAFGDNRAKFTAVPDEFLLSDCFRTLNYSSKVLYLDLCHQYRPASRNRWGNNGDLCIGEDYMAEKYKWPSTTLENAKKELLERKIILEAGAVKHKFNYVKIYALSTHTIDEIKDNNGNLKHDLKPTNKPPNTWKEWKPD